MPFSAELIQRVRRRMASVESVIAAEERDGEALAEQKNCPPTQPEAAAHIQSHVSVRMDPAVCMIVAGVWGWREQIDIREARFLSYRLVEYPDQANGSFRRYRLSPERVARPSPQSVMGQIVGSKADLHVVGIARRVIVGIISRLAMIRRVIIQPQKFRQRQRPHRF